MSQLNGLQRKVLLAGLTIQRGSSRKPSHIGQFVWGVTRSLGSSSALTLRQSLQSTNHGNLLVRRRFDNLLDHRQTYATEGQNILGPEERITVSEYKKMVDSGVKHVLIDVRPPEMAAVGKLDQAVNLPLKQLLNDSGLQKVKDLVKDHNRTEGKIFVVCMKGISSQMAVKYLKDKLFAEPVEIKDIVGGMTAWSKEIDSSVKVN